MLMTYHASDEEILAYYRQHHDPYITLNAAKKHWLYSMRWWHLATSAETRRRQERRDAERLLREKLWPTTRSVARPTKDAGTLEIVERYAAGRPRPTVSRGD
jgi:hypothetical protein